MRALLAILPLAALLASCSFNAEGTVEVRFRSTSEAIEQQPPPDPLPAAIPQLNATIKEIAIHVDRSNGTLKDDESNGWTTIFEGEQRINLLDSTGVAKTLGSAPAPEGTVTQVRLYLGEDVQYVDERGERPVTCPSCTQSGLKLVPSSDVEVDQDGILRLTLNFDGEQSLHDTGNGLMMKPVVHVETALYLK